MKPNLQLCYVAKAGPELLTSCLRLLGVSSVGSWGFQVWAAVLSYAVAVTFLVEKYVPVKLGGPWTCGSSLSSL